MFIDNAAITCASTPISVISEITSTGSDTTTTASSTISMISDLTSYVVFDFTSTGSVMSLHSIQHPFTPFYDAPYIYALQVYITIRPSLQIRSTLALSDGASRFHHYSCDTAGNSHMILCEFHRLLLPWTNLGTMATHCNRLPSPCRIQCVSVVTSLSYLLLYSLISCT